MKKIIPIIALCVLLLSTLACTQKISYVYGAESNVATYTLLEPLPCLNDGTQKCTEGKMVTEVNFADYVRYAFNLIIALSAVAAVLVIVVGGFRYVTTDSFQGKNEGKKTIIEALKGLLLVLCSFLILRTIDPRLVDIPTTLVKPLEIDYEKGVTGSYFDELSSLASRYAARSKEIATDIKNTSTTLSALAAEKKALGERLKSMNQNDPDYELTKQKFDKISNEILENEDSLIVQQVSLTLNAQLKTSSGEDGMSPAQIDESLKIVNTLRDNYTPRLIKSGGYSHINDLNNQANYTQYALELTKNDIYANIRLASNNHEATLLDSNGKPVPKMEEIIAQVSSIEKKISNITNQELQDLLKKKLVHSQELVGKLRP